MDVPVTVLLTNDYPPRVGGIQRTLEALVRELPPDRVVVVAPHQPGWEEFDRAQAYPVVRGGSDFLWPTPRVAAWVDGILRDRGAEVVLFGDAFPLAALGPRLAGGGMPYLVAAHGFDYWLSIVPGPHSMLRWMTARAARVPVLCSRYIARRVRTAVSPRVPVSVLYPGADLDVFRPGLEVAELRARLGLTDRPVVVCVSRLVPRKGQDVLIRAMGEVRRRVPDAALLVVGEGPDRIRLERLAAGAPVGSVVFAGEAREGDLPRHYAVGDVFAMPCRNRLGGLETEGWGNVFIEAAACGLPVIVGDSGGARETLVDGETGVLVDGSEVRGVARAVGDLLSDPERARQMGKAGRARVERDHAWPAIAQTLALWLQEAAGL